MKSRGLVFLFTDKIPLRHHWSRLITVAFVLLAGSCGSRAQNTLSPLTVPTIAALRSLNASTYTNGTVAYVVDYYAAGGGGTYVQGDGGGPFRWWTNAFSNNVPNLQSGSTAVDDGGRFISTPNGTNGIWERMLNGAVPNVKMWGAYGNGATIDTTNINNALRAVYFANWQQQMYFPPGNYLVDSTLTFFNRTYIHGSDLGITKIIMASTANADILQSLYASNALSLHNGTYIDYDHYLHVSDLWLQFQNTNNTLNSCLVICAPGEANSIQRVLTQYGAFGIRCLGTGTPGMRLRDCSFSGAAVAGIEIEPIPGAVSDNNTGLGPVLISGCSSDGISNSTSQSVLLVSNSTPDIEVDSLKAEGAFGGGVIHWIYPDAAGNGTYEAVGSLEVHNSTYLAYDMSPSAQTNLAYLVLSGVNSNATRTPSVIMQNMRIPNIPYLINDEVYGRLIDTMVISGFSATTARLPVA